VKFQGKLFLWLAVFLLAMAIVYGVWSKEAVGTTALFMSFALSIMIGFYLAFTANRADTGAQDREDADVAAPIIACALFGWVFEYYRGESRTQ
jgi:lipopolysaccharide export LptBFGC system permease protein LptF